MGESRFDWTPSERVSSTVLVCRNAMGWKLDMWELPNLNDGDQHRSNGERRMSSYYSTGGMGRAREQGPFCNGLH